MYPKGIRGAIKRLRSRRRRGAERNTLNPSSFPRTREPSRLLSCHIALVPRIRGDDGGGDAHVRARGQGSALRRSRLSSLPPGRDEEGTLPAPSRYLFASPRLRERQSSSRALRIRGRGPASGVRCAGIRCGHLGGRSGRSVLRGDGRGHREGRRRSGPGLPRHRCRRARRSR